MYALRHRWRRRIGPWALLLALGVGSGLPPASRACGYHDPSSVGLGMLNLAYPDALHVRTAVWVAQRDGLIERAAPVAAEPQSPEFMLLQLARLRDLQRRLEALRARVDSGAQSAPVPAFALVLVGSLLWTRYESQGGSVGITVHANGPLPDDVVAVTDAPVVAALADDRLSLKAAREHGLVRFYGAPERVEQVARLLDREAPAPGMTLSINRSSSEAH